MDTQNNVCKPEAEPEAYQIKRIRGVTFPSIAGIKPGPRYYKETTVPFEQDYLCSTCQHTDKSCPDRGSSFFQCDNYKPDLTRIYQPIRKPQITEYAAVDAMLQELERARVKHPQWPTNTLEQVAIMAGESGECLQAALHFVEGRGDIERVRAEAIQTGAMAIRVLMNLEGK